MTVRPLSMMGAFLPILVEPASVGFVLSARCFERRALPAPLHAK